LRGASAPPLRAACGRLSCSARFECWRRRPRLRGLLCRVLWKPRLPGVQM